MRQHLVYWMRWFMRCMRERTQLRLLLGPSKAFRCPKSSHAFEFAHRHTHLPVVSFHFAFGQLADIQGRHARRTLEAGFFEDLAFTSLSEISDPLGRSQFFSGSYRTYHALVNTVGIDRKHGSPQDLNRCLSNVAVRRPSLRLEIFVHKNYKTR